MTDRNIFRLSFAPRAGEMISSTCAVLARRQYILCGDGVRAGHRHPRGPRKRMHSRPAISVTNVLPCDIYTIAYGYR